MRSSKSYNDFNSRNRPQRQDYTQVARSQSHEVSNKKDELDKSTGSLRSVLSALSLSIKSWSKPGSSARNSTRRSPQEDVSELPEEIQDEHRLQRALHDAVRNTDGVGAVEVWILDRSHAQGAHLVQPAGGFWCSKYFMADDYEALARLVDKTRDDYVPPPPMMPGTGLAGVLWNEHRNTVSSHRGGKPLQSTLKSTFGFYATGRSPLSRLSMASSVSSSQSSSVKSFQSMTNLNADYRHSQHSQRSLDAGLGLRFLDNPNELVWRDITSVNVDPYMPTYPRLELMETAGLKKCAGIVFDIKGTSGIVLFLADERVKISRLNLPDNVAFMKASANYIGAAASLVKHRIRLNARINKRPRNIDTDGTNDQSGLIGSVATWLRKCAGGDLQPPPAMPLDETSLTFTGVFVTLLVLHRASSGIEKMTGSGVIFGPFGALMTLQFGLTMAPPAQPRNVIFGQSIATIIALSFSNISEDFMGMHIRVSLTTATAIAAMVLLGIPHPPAGATALIISRGDFTWQSLPAVIISNLIAIAMSTLINNISEKRQYPTFLYMGESIIFDAVFGCCAPDGEFSEDEMSAPKLLTRRASSLLKEANFVPIDDNINRSRSNHSLSFRDPEMGDSPSITAHIPTSIMRKSNSFTGRKTDNDNLSSKPISIPNRIDGPSSPFESKHLGIPNRSDKLSSPFERVVHPNNLMGKRSISFVRSIDQIQNSFTDTTLLAPMDWSSGKKSSNSSIKKQITVDEEDADIGLDLIENEASSFTKIKPGKISDQGSASGIGTPSFSPSLAPLLNTRAESPEEGLNQESRQQQGSQKNLSPLKEDDDEIQSSRQDYKQSHSMPSGTGITYGSIFMMPQAEAQVTDFDDGDLSLGSSEAFYQESQKRQGSQKILSPLKEEDDDIRTSQHNHEHSHSLPPGTEITYGGMFMMPQVETRVTDFDDDDLSTLEPRIAPTGEIIEELSDDLSLESLDSDPLI